jgi:hypothetical protein
MNTGAGFLDFAQNGRRQAVVDIAQLEISLMFI